MKKILNDKLKTILLFLLILVLIIAAILGISVYNSNKKVKVPDFASMSKSDVLTWCGQLNPKFSCEIIYEDSDSVEVDKVISQSVNAGAKIEDKITFKISSGITKEIELPIINSNTTLEDINNWITDNKLVNVTIVNQDNDDVKKGNIIKVEPTSGINKNTPITVYVSNGPKQEEKKDDDKKDDSKPSSDDNTFYIAASDYIGYSVSEFESKAKQLGLNPNHNSSRDAYSNNIEKGKVVWHGYGNYTKNETFNYGLSLGKDDSSSDVPEGSIVVKFNQYTSKTEEDFKNTVKELGLDPSHDPDTDEYSAEIEKGKVVWHGSGNYEKNERIRYGLSLGKKEGSSSSGYIVVPYNKYIDLTVEEFNSKMNELKLKPTHDSNMDKYSDTIAKGKIAWHGNADNYTEGESIRYGLSLGKEGGSDSGSGEQSGDYIVVKPGEYIGLSVSEFEEKAKQLGLKPNHDTGRDGYSDSVEQGKVVTHGYGEDYVKGETFNYGLSLGKSQSGSEQQEDSAYLGSFNDINNVCFVSGDFNKASDNVKSLLANAGFTNYTIVGSSSRDVGVGVLISISVNGNPHTSRTAYPKDASIVVTICNASEAS